MTRHRTCEEESSEIADITARVKELESLVGWCQHHVPRSVPNVPNVLEFLDRAYKVLGSERAHSFKSDSIEPDQYGVLNRSETSHKRGLVR